MCSAPEESQMHRLCHQRQAKASDPQRRQPRDTLSPTPEVEPLSPSASPRVCTGCPAVLPDQSPRQRERSWSAVWMGSDPQTASCPSPALVH